jgi:hypothetical protein
MHHPLLPAIYLILSSSLAILPQRISLHIHCLIKTQHSVLPQKPIYSIGRAIPPRLRNLQSHPIVRQALRDIADQHQPRSLDTLDERGRKVEQPGAADKPHEVVVPRDLHGFFD